MAIRTAPLIDPLIASDHVQRQPPPVRLVARVETIDVLRGLVMVIMLLDHTRDYSHAYSLRYDPADLSHTTAGIFFTRWITHFCAPVFVFLAGTSAYFQRMWGKSRLALTGYLVTRGFWLIVLEFTVVRVGITFNLDPHFFGVAQVLWAIGVSMIWLALWVYVPTIVVTISGAIIIAAHNAFDWVQVNAWTGPHSPVPLGIEKLWMVLHQPGMMPLLGAGSPVVLVLYPLLPWIGVMMIGYGFGALYALDPAVRATRIAQIGMALTAVFAVFRAVDIYGDPNRWLELQTPAVAALSFFNTTKYPPSLLYLCMTLGPALLLLAWLERKRANKEFNVVERWFITYGRVPLFFYLVQWYVAHGLALAAARVAGQNTARLFQLPLPSLHLPGNAGFSLPVVYALWVTAVLLLYLPCRWYGRIKISGRYRWLRYL